MQSRHPDSVGMKDVQTLLGECRKSGLFKGSGKPFVIFEETG